MRRSLPILGFLIGLLAWSLGETNAYAQQGPPRPAAINHVGRWTLRDLGSGPIVFQKNLRESRKGLTIEFPSGAVQPETSAGGAPSYLDHLNVGVAVARRSGSGVVSFLASTHGCVGDMINVHVRARAGQLPLVGWNTTDLIQGTRGHRGDNQSMVVRGTNYIPYCGVHQGATQLAFEMQRYGQVRLKSAVILASSGLEVTRKDPPELKLRSSLSEEPEVGKEFTVRYRLENLGDRPAREAYIRLISTSGSIDVLGPQTKRLHEIRHLSKGVIHAIGTQQGSFSLELISGASNANHPYGSIKGTVLAAGSQESSLSSIWLVVAWGALVVVGGLGLRSILRSR